MKPGLDNQDVRHAINTAIDKESVVTVAYNGMATPALSQMPMNFEGATEENADTYDVEKAKELLAQHMSTCVADDLRAGSDEKLNELIRLLPRLMK